MHISKQMLAWTYRMRISLCPSFTDYHYQLALPALLRVNCSIGKYIWHIYV